MSAPDTNVKKEERRHRPALTGMAVAAGFAGLLLIAFLVYIFVSAGEPEGAETQIDGRTGVETE